MRILVTGSEGQVAKSLAAMPSAHELHFTTRAELDLARPESITTTIERIAPDAIISAAAYTQVDQAEDEPELAMAINGEAPGVIGRAANKIGARVLHLSTDYVFDGSGAHAWAEDAKASPTGMYGLTKLAGERSLAASGASHMIMRTAWVYSPYGKNFVKTMLTLAAKGNPLRVVGDQIGNPTSAADIAAGLLHVIDKLAAHPSVGENEAFHFAGSEAMSWAEFAQAIMKTSASLGGPSVPINPIPSSEYPTKAKRPANSRLDLAKFEATFGYQMPDWRTSLKTAVRQILDEQRNAA